jgi:hypothetical protein
LTPTSTRSIFTVDQYNRYLQAHQSKYPRRYAMHARDDRLIYELHAEDFSEEQWNGLDKVLSIVKHHFPNADVYIAKKLGGNKRRIRIGKFGATRGRPMFGVNIDDDGNPYFRIHMESKIKNPHMPPTIGTDRFSVCKALGAATWNDITRTKFYLEEIGDGTAVDSYVEKFKTLPEKLLKKRTGGRGLLPEALEQKINN